MPQAQDALERLLRRDARMPQAQDALERPTCRVRLRPGGQLIV